MLRLAGCGVVAVERTGATSKPFRPGVLRTGTAAQEMQAGVDMPATTGKQSGQTRGRADSSSRDIQ